MPVGNRSQDIAAGNATNNGYYPPDEAPSTSQVASTQDLKDAAANEPTSPGDALKGASGASGASAIMFYPSELQKAGDTDSVIKHFVEFKAFTITTVDIAGAITKIKENLQNIESLKDVLKGDVLKGTESTLSTTGSVSGTVNLYVPSQVINKIGINYATQSFIVTDNMLAGVGDFLSGGNSVTGMSGGQVAAGVANVAAALAPQIGGLISAAAGKDSAISKLIGLLSGTVGQELQSQISRKTGVAINPRMTAVFKNPELRNFSFNFVFSPRDVNEAKQVRDIIKFFKAAALPNSYGASIFLNFPNEFEITCKTGSHDNKHLFKTKRCVITGIEVNHTPGSLFNAFAGAKEDSGSTENDYAGMSTQSTLSLNFTELDILTSQDITSGVAY